MKPALLLRPLRVIALALAGWAVLPAHAQQSADCGNCDCLFASITTATSGAPNLATAGGGCPGTGTFVVNANTFRRITAPIGNRYTLSVCGSTTSNTVMFVTNNTATGTVRYGCDDDGCGIPNGPSLVQWVSVNNAASGHRVWIFDGDCGTPLNETVTVTFTCEPPPPTPVNDEPCGAIALPLNSGCVYTNTTSTGATLTSSAAAPAGCTDSSGGPAAPLLQNDVWFTTTVPASGLLGIQTEAAGLCAGAFALYTAPSCSGTMSQLPNSCALLGTTGPTTEPAGVFDVSALPVGSTIYIRFWERNGDENGTFQICAYEAQRPPNDEPCGAINLPVTLGCTFATYTNENATPLGSAVTANPDPVTAGCGGPATRDLWFAVTVTADMVANGFTVNTSAGTIVDAAMAWYRVTSGGPCGPGTLTQIACNNNQTGSNAMPSINSGPAGVGPVLGETIYIRVWNLEPWDGTFGICATINQPPPNNLPCGAIPLTANYGCVMGSFSNVNAFNTPPTFPNGSFATGANPSCQAGWNNDVWYTVQMPPNGTIQLDTQVGTMLNGGMALYSATGSCGSGNLSLTQVACANAGSQQGPASSNMPYISYTNIALAGQTLYIRVWRQGAANPDGTFGLCARRTDAPPGDCFYTITLSDSGGDGWQGSFITVCVGGTCTNYTVNGSTSTINVGVNIGQLFTVSYTPVGGFQNQNSYTISQFGQPIFNSGAAPPAGLNYAVSVNCQPPPAPQSDCLGAFTLCDQTITVNQNPSGFGNVQDLNTANRGCLSGNERQGLWYSFQTQCAGNVAFTISPVGSADYDFAVWGPFAGLTCGAALGPPIRCSWAAGSGPTGLAINPALPLSEGAGGSGFVRHLTVNPGDVYILYVDNWSMNGIQFNLSWNASNSVCPPTTQNPTGSIIGCTILPVELLSFDARALMREVAVDWSTASETNSDHFEVQRSADGEHFLPIGRVAAAGDSQQRLTYHLVDDAPLTGVSYYRLKQQDKDGYFSLSEAVPVVFRNGTTAMEVFPNPTLDRTEIRFEATDEQWLRWRLLDASGRSVRDDGHAAHPGTNRLVLDLEGLDRGSYLLELRDASGAQKGMARIVKQ